MSALSALERELEDILHSVIVGFDPEVSETYDRSVKELTDFQQKVEASTLRLASKRSLIARILTHRAQMAIEVEDYESAERLAGEVLKSVPIEHSSFALSILIRTEALHCLGRHQEEVAQATEYIGTAAIAGSSLLHLLAKLATRHPNLVDWKDSFVSPIRDHLATLLRLSGINDRLPTVDDAPREYILRAAELAQRINRELTARALREGMEEDRLG